MKTWINVWAAMAAGLMVWTGVALGQGQPADCPKPEKVEGQIVKIDANEGKLALRGPEGKTYEFNASKETLQDKKVGDRLEVTRRMPDNCK